MESNDSPEIPDRGETSDIPGLPSGVWLQTIHLRLITLLLYLFQSDFLFDILPKIYHYRTVVEKMLNKM